MKSILENLFSGLLEGKGILQSNNSTSSENNEILSDSGDEFATDLNMFLLGEDKLKEIPRNTGVKENNLLNDDNFKKEEISKNINSLNLSNKVNFNNKNVSENQLVIDKVTKEKNNETNENNIKTKIIEKAINFSKIGPITRKEEHLSTANQSHLNIDLNQKGNKSRKRVKTFFSNYLNFNNAKNINKNKKFLRFISSNSLSMESSKIDTEKKENNINFTNNNNKEALNTNTSNKNFAAVNSKGIELNLNLEGSDSQKSNDLNSINNNLLKNILDIKSNNFNQRLAEIFERNIKMGHNKFEIEIKPENLGKIEISLDIHGDKVDINMKVDSNTVANLITEGSSSLQKSFNSQGLNLGNLNLNFNNQNKFGEDNLKKEKNDKNKDISEDESLDLKIEKHYKDNNIVYIKA